VSTWPSLSVVLSASVVLALPQRHGSLHSCISLIAARSLPGSPGDPAASSATGEASPTWSSSTETPSSSGASAPSDEGASSSDANASDSTVGPEISLAGADVTPLVELLKQKEGDENYALKTSWGTYADMSPLKRKWQVVSVALCAGFSFPAQASREWEASWSTKDVGTLGMGSAACARPFVQDLLQHVNNI
jgi:hypothetical protein